MANSNLLYNNSFPLSNKYDPDWILDNSRILIYIRPIFSMI